MPPRILHGKEGILNYLQRVRCIQFDPLDIVGQNAELVMQSRVSDFSPAMLRQLLYEDRKLIDGSDKVMSIWPVEDWPYFQRKRKNIQSELRSNEAVRTVAPQVRAEIEKRGPLSSIDLEFNQKVDWWWAPTNLSRATLESMYYVGELIIHHKVHTRKVYDLVERHIPFELLNAPEPNPNETEYHDWYLLRRLGSLGMYWNRSGEVWLDTPLKSVERQAAIKRQIALGTILPVQVDGVDIPMYIRTQDQPLLNEVLSTHDQSPMAAFLAPLDNLLWDRRYIELLFGFEYRWEVYVPPKKRKYGYYVLPVLYGDLFVARFEPIRNKKDGILTIKNWWWEPDVIPDNTMLEAIQECLEYFCVYLGVDSIQIDGHCSEPDKTDWLAKKIGRKDR